MQRPPLSLQQLELLQRQATPRERLLLTLLYETGCTASELVTLRRRHLEARHLRVGKRRVPLTRQARNTLLSLLRELNLHRGYLCTSREGGRMSVRRAEQILAALGRRALGRPITPSQLRATRIIHDFLRNEPVTRIEQRVGLKSIQPYLYQFFKERARWSL